MERTFNKLILNSGYLKISRCILMSKLNSDQSTEEPQHPSGSNTVTWSLPAEEFVRVMRTGTTPELSQKAEER